MRNFRFISFLLLLSLSNLNLLAQTVADFWISMPAEFVPYIDVNQKKEMIECVKIGVDTSVKNKFEGKTLIDTLTADYGKFIVSNSRSIEIARLPYDQNDSIIMFIDTYLGPEAHSRVAFYDGGWNKLSTVDKLPQITLKDLIVKPDTMSIQDFENLEKLISPELIEYKYDFIAKTLVVSPSLPLLTTEEKNKLKTVICKRILKYNGKTFN